MMPNDKSPPEPETVAKQEAGVGCQQELCSAWIAVTESTPDSGHGRSRSVQVNIRTEKPIMLGPPLNRQRVAYYVSPWSWRVDDWCEYLPEGWLSASDGFYYMPGGWYLDHFYGVEQFEELHNVSHWRELFPDPNGKDHS